MMESSRRDSYNSHKPYSIKIQGTIFRRGRRDGRDYDAFLQHLPGDGAIDESPERITP
ncbi:hypothetical protein KC19_VG239700 [Ceratodon purpureus]|uniref:Uncharacterized protein n=1 Tax=Ceratodon purpureus TaxID=3225 RepID=A0A8T0HT27_CERPU|nr:hypothetical protein KC19_VG238500 [Ceratodon purpureus]KAG0574164.1 hypothetical protein KC19_VG239700 [Ceratodon purpureus]